MQIANQHAGDSIQTNRKPSFAILAPYFKSYLLPVLAAAYPSLFFYGNNVHNLLLTNLGRTIILYILIATIVYLAFIVKNRNSPQKAAIATLVFLVFFNLYGMLENLLLRLDWFTVYDFVILPVTLLVAGYVIWLITKLTEQASRQIWNFAAIVLGGLIFYNLVIIIPAEVYKQQQAKTINSEYMPPGSEIERELPDIYYIIFDEFSGLKPMRDYWNNPKANEFEKFLISKGFTVFQDPHGSSTNTLREIATRLNYQHFTWDDDPASQKDWFDSISKNRVMDYLKQQGYKVVTFNETQFAIPSATSIDSDVTYNYEDIPTTNLGVFFDEFGVFVANNTMMNVFSSYYTKLSTSKHADMVFFTTNKVGELSEIVSPKFVYIHLIIPHAPFMFDEKGNVNVPTAYNNYTYYLDNYNFSIYLATKMVTNILSNASPKTPPVIILQSDHGLRNSSSSFVGQLENFPDEYKTSILYALRLPGYEPSFSTQEMDPINTFPIVFNHLFNAGIPLK